jgi:signal transduction histidine kinase
MTERGRWLLVLCLLTAAACVQAMPRPSVLLALVRALCDLLALYAVHQRGRHSQDGRRLWAFLQAGLFLFLLGDLFAGMAFLNPKLLPVPEWASTVLLHFLPIPMFLLALMTWTGKQQASPVPRFHALLDGLLFGYAAYYLIWVLGIRFWEGVSRSSQASSGLVARFVLLGLLLGTCVFRGSRNPVRWRGPLVFLGSAFLLLTIASALSAASMLGGQGPAFRMVANVLKPAALLLIAAAAWRKVPLEGDAEEGRPSVLVESMRDHLPFAPAVLATFGALFLGGLQQGLLDPRIVSYGAPMVGLLLVRQFMAFQDLKRFSSGLEAKVEARTRALETAQAIAIRTERMNTLAMLGAGLAHDLNNSIAAIRASAELMAEDMHTGAAPAERDLDRILVASDQAANLGRRLMSFGRDEAHGTFELRQEIHEMEDLLRMLLPRRIQLRVALGQGSFPVSGTRSHLEQMLVNLVANARDAIAGEGSISLELLGGTGSSGPEALVRVEDTGIGMPPEIQARLFEPFFTTKEPGKGTGLGLSSVRTLVEQVSGRIEMTSHPGLGTTFTLIFPIEG